MTRPSPSPVTDGGLVERIFAEVDAETAEVPPMDARQIAYAVRAVRKAIAASDRDVLVDENARLRKALKPFARIAELRESYSDPEAMLVMISLTQCREARAALIPLGGDNNELR